MNLRQTGSTCGLRSHWASEGQSQNEPSSDDHKAQLGGAPGAHTHAHAHTRVCMSACECTIWQAPNPTAPEWLTMCPGACAAPPPGGAWGSSLPSDNCCPLPPPCPRAPAAPGSSVVLRTPRLACRPSSRGCPLWVGVSPHGACPALTLPTAHSTRSTPASCRWASQAQRPRGVRRCPSTRLTASPRTPGWSGGTGDQGQVRWRGGGVLAPTSPHRPPLDSP